jgi:hypothetical protein
LDEIKFIVSDILNQNKNIARNVTETYIEDARYTALQRYFMGMVTYTIRKFGKPGDAPNENLVPTPERGQYKRAVPRDSISVPADSAVSMPKIAPLAAPADTVPAKPDSIPTPQK